MDSASRAGADALSKEKRSLVELWGGRQYVLRRVTDKYAIDLLRLESKAQHERNAGETREARDAGHPKGQRCLATGDENTVPQSRG